MSVSQKAKNKDASHVRRFKKLTPKARFKTLSKSDQFIVTARALSSQLLVLRKSRGLGTITLSLHITLRAIDRRYIEADPATGFLTKASVQKIKRAVANAFKATIGADAQFMFVVEQQDKNGTACDPHIHALAIFPLNIGSGKRDRISDLKKRLHKVAGESEDETVKIDTLSLFGKHPKELTPGDANMRRTAGYAGKNEHSHHYRSEALMVHVHAHFEELKKHHEVLS